MPSNEQTQDKAGTASPAAQFLDSELYRLGGQPGLRSLPPGPERDFLTLTWGPIVYRTTYAPESDYLAGIFLRALNEEMQASLCHLPGTTQQLALLEKTYATKVFTNAKTYQLASEGAVRSAFHDFKITLALPCIELPVRLRICLVVDEWALAMLANTIGESADGSEESESDSSEQQDKQAQRRLGQCPVKVVEENFPDFYRRDSNPAVGDYPGWTAVVLSSLMEVFDGMRKKKNLKDYHRPGRVYVGNGEWA